MMTTDEAGYIEELEFRLQGVPQDEWSQHVTEYELELLRKHGVL